MLNRILDLYSLLFKYAEKKLPQSEDILELLENLDSGWDDYPAKLKVRLNAFTKSVDLLNVDVKRGANDSEIRNSLVSLQYTLGDISSIASMMENDIEEILEQTLDVESEINIDHISIDTCEYSKEILKNDFNASNEFSESSFTSILHETEVWDFKEYWKLELAFYALGKRESTEVKEPLFLSVFSIYSSLLMSIGCSLDSNDGFTICNLDYESLRSMRERLIAVVEGLFNGNMPDNEVFKFKNPYL